MAPGSSAAPLWTPSAEAVDAANVTALMKRLSTRHGIAIDDHDALWRFSIEHMADFWDAAWDFFGVVAQSKGERVLLEADAMADARFFVGARLSYPENLLRRSDDGDAIVWANERGARRCVSWAALRQQTAKLAAALSDMGVEAGDVVAGYLPNIPETVVAMLAATSLGATWTSCGMDFGVRGVLDRFGQTKPKVLVCSDGHHYAGKGRPALSRVREVVDALPDVARVVVVGYLNAEPEVGAIRDAVAWDDVLDRPDVPLVFQRLPFDHPLYVMYSSGTTGVPKCIVHRAGGVLLQHLKEHRLHFDIKRGDRVFYFSTLGWMMWNWLVSALASDATIMLYDGSPMHPSPAVLFDYAETEAITHFGVSAKYIDAVAASGFVPRDGRSFDALRMVASTGSPLSSAGFDWVYQHVRSDVLLGSVSGGTDILCAFVGANPIAPVWRGEIQGPALGMAVDVFDEAGRPLREHKGELVCTRPFPTMPLGFWGDDDGQRFHAAYFGHYDDVWRHGDFAEITAHGGYIIHGRSDATLNPGGVRIGTAEIYRVVEGITGVAEALAIGQVWQDDTRVVLFVRLEGDRELDDSLEQQIRQQLRQQCSPRHVPAKILQVADIPRTKTGKIVELAVRDVVHGREPQNLQALDNPEALASFRDRPELA